MRRACFTVLTLLFLISFSGCSGTSLQGLNPEDLIFTFQANADVSCGGQQTKCVVSRSAPGVISIQVSSGELNGLTWFWEDAGFSVSFSGLTAQSEECVLPKTSFAYLIKQTLDSAANTGALTRTHGNEFSGSSPGYDFTLTADEATGHIQTLNIPKYGMTVSFHDFSELGVS